MQKETNRIMNMIVANKDKYEVTVDNDSVWVTDIKTEEEVATFDEFGYHLLVELFRYFKINADFC